MPPGHGLAFVVILHLPANRKSMLPDILSRWTSMRVVEATDNMPVEANTIYVPPPQATTTLVDGHLHILMPSPQGPREGRLIDHFFDSLASSLRECAIGIVLSGTGTDGSLGLKAIKENGGLTMAQGADGTSPEYDGMPTGAIATGAVDLIASVEAMPGHLIRLTDAWLKPPDLTAETPPEAIEGARLAICAILRSRLNHDFTGYKQKTFLRRVQRRMQVLNLPDMRDYVERLREDREEVVLLFRDLLIRVTSFFRDADAFDALARIALPRLFQGASAGTTIRVWVPGCATGEEAYSLAILLREHMDGLEEAPRVQVFATDIDEPAIAAARSGRYPTTLLEGLSEQRRNRFFTQTNTAYVVTKEIRELCTFSEHSLVRDPPFSRIDLISCRNLLIYLDNDLQTRVIPAFHYALVPGGILLLGSSETTTRHEELFTTLDKAARIFQRRDVPSPPLKIFAEGLGGHSNGMSSKQADCPSPRPWIAATAPRSGDGKSGHDQAGPNGVSAGAQPVNGFAATRIGRVLSPALRRFSPGALVRDLQDHLSQTAGELQAVREEHETALEELRSSNEELQSVNEEFQSTNEELETSKEEIQSVNEELHTVNLQLSDKVDELDRTNSDLKNLFESTDVATIFLDRHLVIRGYTPAVGTIYNLIPSDHGRPVTDIVHHLTYTGLRDDVSYVLNTLEPLERRVSHEDGETHYILRILPYRGPNSEVNGTLVTFLNVTSIVLAEQHQRLLVDELNHRVKNMLTVVISMAQQTLRRAATLDEFSSAFMGRVHALTASYTLLSRQNWSSVPLRDILVEEAKPYLSLDGSNIGFEGPLVLLNPQGALAIGMAIHELATNAVKYGALSTPDGSIRVSWKVEDNGGTQELLLDWVETGGPLVAEPTHRGFGMTLIERGFAHELSGQAFLEFRTDGVRARLIAPIGPDVTVPLNESHLP